MVLHVRIVYAPDHCCAVVVSGRRVRLDGVLVRCKAVFNGDLNQEDLEVFLFQIEKSMFYGQLNQED